MRLASPRQVLDEIKRAKNTPVRISRIFNEIHERLEARGLLDAWMSSQSIEDLLDEMVEACCQPMTGEEMAAEFDRLVKKMH